MWSPGRSQNEYTPHVFLAMNGTLPRRHLPSAALERLRAQADEAMTAGPWSVMNKARPAPSGDKHDYISLRTYISDGVIDPDVALYDRLRLNAFAEALDALSTAWAVTRERAYAERAALLHSDLGVGEALADNNHGTWYRVQVASFASFAGSKDLARATCILSAPLLHAQIAPDGSQPLEQRRTRGLFYSLFNVQGWCMLSQIASQLGLAEWGPASPLGRRLQQAMDYLVPYLAGRPWPHQQIDEMDHRRSAGMLCFAAAWWKDARYAAALSQLPADTLDARGRLLYGDASAAGSVK